MANKFSGNIYLGADHRGLETKNYLRNILEEKGYKVFDLGAYEYQKNDDYPEFAAKVAKKAGQKKGNRGIVVCGSGVGVDVVANKFKGVRSAFGLAEAQVKAARSDDDANVLSLAADFTGKNKAANLALVFLKTPFKSASRFRRRLKEISGIENR
ncbi:MAG: RpiB/LacA/LacB family sugar-phosphate isomerase [Patescibacteria group bacterium]|nr:RpiB/LacA/LacB family sugar-phosphate isomerase [Patescibacteria group bacterium]